MHRQFIPIGLSAVALSFAVCVANRALGQDCPRASATGPTIASHVRTLEGRLVFHDGIRQWFELKLDQPQCGQTSIQLIELDQKSARLEVLRDCRIRSTGTVDVSPTGYYSLDAFQHVETVEPVGMCPRRRPFPHYSRAKPDNSIQAYRVDMRFTARPGDHPVLFHVSGAGRELRPWQAYASYWLTGGFVLYGRCGEGFVIDRVFGTPEAEPTHFLEPRTPEDMAAFDPESAAQAGRWDLHLGFTCIRGTQ